MIVRRLALAALLLAASGVRAAGPPRLSDPSQAEDVQDVLVFTENRPLHFRLHLREGDRPFGARWEAHLRKVFAFLDRDGDGFLDKEEAARSFTPQQLLVQFQGNVLFVPQGSNPFMEDMDANRDGKVSPDEFLRYYRRHAAGPVQLAPVNPAAGVDTLTGPLIAALDTNKDGKLSREELAAAADALGRYDQNDDELVTAQEVLSDVVPARRPVPAQPGMRVLQQGNPLMLVPREEVRNRVTQRSFAVRELLVRYDKNNNRKLSRQEIGLPKERFDQADVNKDGELDTIELLRWLIGLPDVEVVLHLGDAGAKGPANLLEVVGANRKGSAQLARVSDTTVALDVDGARIHLLRSPGLVNANPRQTGQPFLQQFRAADREGKGYLTKRDLEGKRQFPFLLPLLDVADRDDDGRLTEKEVKAWLDLISGAPGCQATVTFAESGRGLFQMLDRDNDGRLSVRELRTAAALVAKYDRDGDGCLSRAEVPRHFTVVVNRGPSNGAFPAPAARPDPNRPARGPLWFRKMDANGDGDVSRREFLGSAEAFRRIDTDGDGLISLEEAEKADRLLRKKK